MKPLTDFSEGDRVRIVQITSTGTLKMRLLEMGLYRGEEVGIVKYAPLKDPLELVLRTSHLSLRVHEAEQIMVEPIAE